MSEDDNDQFLSADEVMHLIDLVYDCNPIIVGGQSLNIWAERYSSDPWIADHGPYASKDIDFFSNMPAARRMADGLEGGVLRLPDPHDATPNAAVVVGDLNGRRVRVDFMATVLGVDNSRIMNSFVAVEGTDPSGAVKRISVMHPLDCVRSRLANINRLYRLDDHSVNQAILSVHILRAFLDELLKTGDTKEVQNSLVQLSFVIRNDHLGKTSHTKLGHALDLLGVMEAFVDDERLDHRWRSMILQPAIARTIDRISRRETRMTGNSQSDPGDSDASTPDGLKPRT